MSKLAINTITVILIPNRITSSVSCLKWSIGGNERFARRKRWAFGCNALSLDCSHLVRYVPIQLYVAEFFSNSRAKRNLSLVSRMEKLFSGVERWNCLRFFPCHWRRFVCVVGEQLFKWAVNHNQQVVGVRQQEGLLIVLFVSQCFELCRWARCPN